MSTGATVPIDPLENANLFYSILESIKKFNDIEVKGVLMGQLNPNDRENCFLSSYFRAVYNVDSMLELKHVLHFQALAMLARTMIEIAADSHLIAMISDSVEKILGFNQLEKLRAAKGVLSYESKHTLTFPHDTTPYSTFVKLNETAIMSQSSKLWPGKKPREVGHWTGMNLRERVEKVGQPLEEIYLLFHRMLSWYVHSGGTGIMGVPKDTFPSICTLSYRIATMAFEEIINVTVREFKVSLAISSLDKKLELARYLPLTVDAEQERKLAAELGLPTS